jgi:hypothetical protein
MPATLGRALALALVCVTSGCAARVDVGKSLGEGPHVRLPYAGVRDSLRRFADYSAVRGDILVPPPASPKRPPDERRRP